MSDRKKGQGGFRLKPLDLTIADGHFAGLAFTASIEASLDEYLFYRVAAEDNDGVKEKWRKFGEEILIDWDVLDKHGNLVPPTGEGFSSMPPSLCRKMVDTWCDGVISPPAPLESPSSDGEISQELPTPIGQES